MATKNGNMSLGAKLVAAFLACGLIPLCLVAFISYNTASQGMDTINEHGEAGLEKNAYNQLVALRDVKKRQVENYFAERQGDMGVLMETVGTLREEALNKLVSLREVKKRQVETYFDERKGDMGVLVETVNTLRSEAFNKLRANRDVKRAAVERYFQSINDQILTFSEDQMVIDAMRELGEVFGAYKTETKVSDDVLQKQKDELRTYYTGDFSNEYQSQNDGNSPGAEQFFDQLDEDSVALQHAYIWANQNPLGSKHLLDQAPDESRYSALHSRLHPIVRNYLDKFGYYDIFLVDPETGDIVYSVFKELDFSTSLIDGPYAKTNFGEAFRAANAADNKDAVVLVDYKQYPPSYQAPASFIASPIFDGDKKIGVAMFQMPIDRLNAIMSERSGLGETGETYLVGSDLLMRTDSYLDPQNHSVMASFRHPEKGKVDTAAARASLAGESGTEVVIDYHGNPVLSAYCPVKVGDFTWGLLAEIDVAEAFCPKDKGGEYFFKKYTEKYGYYDLFLMNPDGYCFYTVAQEADYKTNFVDGKYHKTNLGELTREVLKSKQFGFADFAPYAPSNGAPAAFVAQPVMTEGNTELIVALQLPLDAINRIMGIRAGMGETGETYLIGPDKLMRSDSFLDPTHHTVAASFADPTKGSVDTVAANEALAGKANANVILDYNGNAVISAYTPIDVYGTTWGLLAEIDVAEAFCPKDKNGEYYFKKYADMYGYYDLFLLTPDGYCFYSAAREADYQTNLVDGKYADSNLGELVRKVLGTKTFGFADFRPYAPSDGDPAAFIAQPVVNEGKTEMVVALQLPLDAINGIMSIRAGMGETGETYLIGSDKLMRSDSFLDATNHTVAASFKNPATGSVNTDAANAALQGDTDAKIVTDYNGNPVLSAYTPLDVFGTRWALLAEIDESEALAAAHDMQTTAEAAGTKLLTWIGVLAAIAAVAVGLVSVMVARSISKPINRIIAGLNEGADQVNDAAGQVASASQGLAEGASEQASSLEETSSALEQMAAMTRTNAGNAKQANDLSNQARAAAENGDKTMEQLNNAMTAINDSSGQISKIIKVIEEIAFQTNLLALNAAVEAARAGEHGKGFAVVADEVRNLAQRAAQAARETTGLIEDSVNKAKEGTQVAGEVGGVLGTIVSDVTKVAELINGITEASDEQAQGVDQVNSAVSQMDKVTQQNAAGAEESASAAEELAAQASNVKGMVDELATLVGGGNHSGNAAAPAKRRSNAPLAPRSTSPTTTVVTAATDRGQPHDANEFMQLDDAKDMKNF